MNNENLKHFKKGQSGNPNGRPPKAKNIFKKIPEDARERIAQRLNEAISAQSVKKAKELLAESEEMGEYGFVLQLAIRELTGKNGWQALNDILDRICGKPKQTAEVTHKGGTQIIVNAPDKDTAEEIEKL